MSDEARYWTHPAAPGVNLMQARFVRHAFGRHSHPTFAIGVVQQGVERLRIGDTTELVGPGGLAMINPDVVHTGSAATPDGWAYRVMYPPAGLLESVARTGSPRFGRHLVYDADAAAVVLAAHNASEHGDRLASSSLLHTALTRLWSRYGQRTDPARESAAGGAQVETARALLHARLLDPPSLDELATEVGVGRFALVRAFRARYGLPPHAYLNEQRVRRACTLLDAGAAPSAVAAEVGFADQAHLTRHFRRTLGVPPGQYRCKNVQDPA